MMRFRFRSIRWTMFLIYALILLVTFSLFSGLIYFYFRHELVNKVDALLEVKASGLDDSIRTYLKTRSVPSPVPTGWARFFSRAEESQEAPFVSIADFLTENKFSPPEHQAPIFIDIFDADGSLIASSNTPPPISVSHPGAFRRARQGERQYYTYSTAISGIPQPVQTRALLKPLMDKNQLLYLIQARTSMRTVEAELNKIAHTLAILVLIMLFVASWAGLFFVKLTLLPVNKMVRKIRNIQPDNLSDRLALPKTHDEIRWLAITFNDMLARMQKSFVAQEHIMQDLSHELKTPLTIMRGQIDITLRKQRSAGEYKSLLHSSLEEINKMKRIIDSLLMLARLDSHADKFEIRPLDLNELLRTVLDDAQVLAHEKNITGRLSSPPVVSIEANESHMRRLFSNILENAVKYTPEGGQIEVSVEPAKEGVWIKIKDSGVGIPADQLPHVFNRFYRGEKGRAGDSYGLGLSIVKSIVDAHQGRIEIDSAPGKGTTVSLYFHKHPPINWADLLGHDSSQEMSWLKPSLR